VDVLIWRRVQSNLIYDEKKQQLLIS
jgi:hypothetical protein